MADINFEVNKNSIEGKSVVVLRTNPALSTNVKLVTDSSGEIYLDSIDANRTLADQRFKKFNLDQNGHYAYDLAKFYADVPLNITYETYRTDSDVSVYREYEKQYEEQYQYGARLNSSRVFDENIRFMAPLWLDKNLPEYFVIYRVEEPVSTVGLSDDISSINDRTMAMLSNAKIVKAFDMRPGSKLGNYLNRFVNDPNRPYAPVTTSFESDEKTSWNGIDLIKGGFTTKGEYIHNAFVKTDRTEIENNDFITSGFRRNKMASSDLINLEFLFEDNDNPYEVNRYFGVYVNAHEEGSFKATRYVNDLLSVDLSTVATNYDLTGTTLTPVDMLPHEDIDKPVLQWFKSNYKFSHVQNTEAGQLVGKFSVKELDLNLSDKYIKLEQTLEISSVLPNVSDFITITIDSNPVNGDQFALASKSDFNITGLLDNFIVYADSVVPAGKTDGAKFSVNGTTEHVALALKTALESILDSNFILTVYKNVITIQNYSSGNRLYNSFFASKNTNSNGVTINVGINDNTDKKLKLGAGIYTNWDIYVPQGGSAVNSGYLVVKEELGDIVEDTYIKIRNSYSKIVELIQDPFYTDYYRVCLDKSGLGNTPLLPSVNLYVENKISFGKFEMYNFVDFDYNFYSTRNSELNELAYENEGTNVDFNQVESVANIMMSPSTYFKSLEGVKNPITPTSAGSSFINNEYDRLRENHQTQFALTSRIVPNINKWVYKDGLNSKEKPYFLTMSEAFGKTNLSPDIKVSGRDESAMTHEWFYIYGKPNYTTGNPIDITRSLYSYIQPEDGIDLTDANLKDVTLDYFDRLFVYEGNLTGGWIPAKMAKKYNRFIKGSSSSPAETMFRGLKVKAYSRKEFNQVSPKNLINTSEFNGYKFTSVLKYTYNSEDSVSIKAIQNKKWKTITLFIDMQCSDDSISFVNRKLMYELRDFFSGGIPSETTVNGYINFDVPQKGSPTIDGIGVGTRLIRDIQVNADGAYNDIHFDYLGDTWVLPIVKVVNSTSIVFKDIGIPGSIENLTKTNILTVTSIPETIWSNIVFKYQKGSYNLAKSTFESISAKEIADILNSNDSSAIEYITIEEDGTQFNNRFILNIEDGNDVSKLSNLTFEADPVKPDSYKVSPGAVGYVTTERETPYTAKLIRMSGDYTPLFRDVTFFTDLYKAFKVDLGGVLTPDLERQKLIYNRFNRLGVAFGSYINVGYNNFGLLEDVFYHKVNPEKADSILKLSNTTSSLPLYPLIGEVAIGTRNINILRSSWEDGFYTKSDTTSTHNVFGTLSAHEESAYLASTLNLPRNQYNVTSFDSISTATSLDDMKSIRDANNFKGGVVFFENDSNVYIDLYLSNRMVSLMSQDNAGVSIKKYVNVSESYGDKTTLDDDIKQYIEVNLLKLLSITDIRVFSKKTNEIKNSQILNADSLGDMIDAYNFAEDKDFRLEYDNRNPLNVRVIYNKRPGFKHQIYLYVKINS